MTSTDESFETALQDAQSMLPGAISGTFFFGIFTLLLAFSIHILKSKGLHTRVYAVMLTLIILMYALAATSWAVLVSALLQTVEHPEAYALQDASALVMKDKTLEWCLGLNLFMSDAILSWRTWSVWSGCRKRRWIGVMASLFLFGTAVSGAVDLGVFSLRTVIPDEQNTGAQIYDDEPSIVFANFSGELSVIFSAILNVSCVALSAMKTRELERLQRPVGRRFSENRVGMILLLLTLCELTYCVFWVYWVAATIRIVNGDMNLTLLICNNTVAAQITGLYPSFVIVCVSMQKVNEGDVVPSVAVWRHQPPSPVTFAENLIQPPANALVIPMGHCSLPDSICGLSFGENSGTTCVSGSRTQT